MAKTKKEKKVTEPEFRSLLGADNKFKPLTEVYNGYEIEKRWVLLTHEEDFSKGGNGVQLYHEALRKGVRIVQGYIMDMDSAIEMVSELGIVVEFKPNTVRLRSFDGKQFILTLKDKKETKRREVEWELDKKTFQKYWKLTKGHRVHKNRYKKEVKGNVIEFDAFTDRYLLMAEIEVKDEAQLEKLPKLGLDVTTDSSWTNKKLAK